MSSTQMDVAWAHTTILKDVLEAASQQPRLELTA